MGYEANLCSLYYISQPSLKNVSRVFNETEAVTQQQERKEERGDLFAKMFAQREEKAAGGRVPDSASFPQPSNALILSLVAARPPVLSFEEHKWQPCTWPPLPLLLGGACASPSNVWRGG